ncbi:hypothetical protein M2263_004271 [Providencia alcalifaciens]|nr:hypothetical protein [Providencia alcalifaciens]
MNIENSSLINIAKNKISSNRRLEQEVLLARRVKSIRNVSINLHPKKVGNGYIKYQAFSMEIIDEKKSTMGYISNFRGTGEEALLIHGSKTGKIALLSRLKKQKGFSVKEFISYIKENHNINLDGERRGKIHIISCYGGSNGVYQSFANELGRTVIGYGDRHALSTSTMLKSHFKTETSKIKSVIGDVMLDKPENLKRIPVSVHKYIPLISKK